MWKPLLNIDKPLGGLSMKFFDSHAHLTSPQISHVKEMLERARAAAVSHIINICTDIPTLEQGLELSKTEPRIYNAAATTPHDVEKEAAIFFPLVQQMAKEKKLIAIGETGLDYYYEHSDRALQKAELIRYFHLGLETNLPIIIHCRDAFSDLFDIADSEYRDAPLLLHCFTGTKEEAKKALDRNWSISFSGIITFKKSESIREALKEVPLSHILVETDTPYLAPQSKRGMPNEPSFLPETVAALAAIKGISIEDMAKRSFENTVLFFGIDDSN
jgi:TatD DNase family protein